jgi:hypothetical protein
MCVTVTAVSEGWQGLPTGRDTCGSAQWGRDVLVDVVSRVSRPSLLTCPSLTSCRGGKKRKARRERL